jgi:hypothetical protein
MPNRLPIAPIVYLLSGMCVVLGVSLSFKLRHQQLFVEDALHRYDVTHYQEIVERGYGYDPQRRSLVAFFPVYPLTAWCVKQFTGMTTLSALLLVSNLCLYGTFLLFAVYLKQRENARTDETPSFIDYSLAAFAFFPTTFFFRIPYSESSFLFFAILSFYAMARRWPVWAIALAIGATTATRPVGIAMLVPFAVHLTGRFPHLRHSIMQGVLHAPLAISGLAAYMTYQFLQFGDPLAFAKTQEHWSIRLAVPLSEKLLALGSLEPFWAVFVPGSPYHWLQEDWSIFSLNFMNPFYFAGTAVLIGMGAWKNWLTREEIAVSIPLLLIPYLTRGFEWGLMSHARFAAVVFPAYIVMGHLLRRLPPVVAVSLLALSAFLMGAYAALFAAGHGFY